MRFVLLLLLSSFAILHSSFSAQPNIVLILADDLGYGDLGCYGATKVKTPNIDQLASEGRRFTDAHSASAVCTPSRYALLTGEYPFRKNLWGPVMNPSPLVVDVSKPTVASLLKRQGYATACFGKWHLGFGDKPKPDWNADLKPGPLECGFDHYFGIPVVNSHPPFVWVEDHRVVGLDPADPLKYGGKAQTRMFPEKMLAPAMSGGKAAHALYNEEEHGTTLTEKATAWIKQHASTKNKEPGTKNPFFVYFATPHIHHPFTPGARFKGSSQADAYGDFIQEFDWMVGEVIRTLDELKLRESTLVILTSDNGGMLNQGGQAAWKAGHRLNGDLLGFKFDAWEGGHRVPFIARWPGKIPAGKVSTELITMMDMLPTLAALSGGEKPKDRIIDGHDIRPLLFGEPEARSPYDAFFYYYTDQLQAVRSGPWKLYLAGANRDAKGGKKAASDPKLFHLINDPEEKDDQFARQPEFAKRLLAHAEVIRADLGERNRPGKGVRPVGKVENPTPRLLER